MDLPIFKDEKLLRCFIFLDCQVQTLVDKAWTGVAKRWDKCGLEWTEWSTDWDSGDQRDFHSDLRDFLERNLNLMST